MKLLTVLIGCFLIVISCQMRFGNAAPTDVEDEDPVDNEESVKDEEPFHEISKRSTSSAVTEYIEAMQGARNYHFTHYRCRLRSIFLRAQEKVHMMPVTPCRIIHNPLPPALQQRYDQLSSPMCTDVTHLWAMLYNILLNSNYNDVHIRHLVCQISQAIYHLETINRFLAQPYCPTFSINEYILIFNAWFNYYTLHSPPLYCTLRTLQASTFRLQDYRGRGVHMSDANPSETSLLDCNWQVCGPPPPGARNDANPGPLS
ncbi:uncharacterized protein [Dysidea avara]|uniref:uncharacterized protein n=1 Tax=Dysidea avara TaxID=196820 RepID=UPI00331C1305